MIYYLPIFLKKRLNTLERNKKNNAMKKTLIYSDLKQPRVRYYSVPSIVAEAVQQISIAAPFPPPIPAEWVDAQVLTPATMNRWPSNF